MIFDGYQFVAFLMGIGVVLILAETLLPTHGVLGFVGGGAVLWAVFAAARQNVWSGVALLVAVVAAIPIVWAGFIKYWPRTPLGRKIVLQPIESSPQELVVRVGQTGIALSELRPMGMCEFDGVRIESISEHGIVPPGTNVRVVALTNNRPTVRIA